MPGLKICPVILCVLLSLVYHHVQLYFLSKAIASLEFYQKANRIFLEKQNQSAIQQPVQFLPSVPKKKCKKDKVIIPQTFQPIPQHIKLLQEPKIEKKADFDKFDYSFTEPLLDELNNNVVYEMMFDEEEMNKNSMV